MKKILLLAIVFLSICSYSYGQTRYFTRTGRIHFVSSTPIIDIAGTNDQVFSFLDIETGEIVVGLVMKSFKFKQALAEEHFNENYVESHKYPKARFKGKVEDFDLAKFFENKETVAYVSGDLTIHGVSKRIRTKVSITMEKEQIKAKATFVVAVKDFNIEIPGIVRDKVAKTIPVEVEFVYEPYEG